MRKLSPTMQEASESSTSPTITNGQLPVTVLVVLEVLRVGPIDGVLDVVTEESIVRDLLLDVDELVIVLVLVDVAVLVVEVL